MCLLDFYDNNKRKKERWKEKKERKRLNYFIEFFFYESGAFVDGCLTYTCLA